MHGIFEEPIELIDTEGILEGEKNDGECLKTIETSSSTPNNQPTNKPKIGLAYRIMDFVFNRLEGEKNIDYRSITSCGGVTMNPGDGHHSLDMSDETLRIGEMGVERGRVITQSVDGVTQFVKCDHLRKGFRGRCSCALAHVGNDTQNTVSWEVSCIRKDEIEKKEFLSKILLLSKCKM